MLKLKIKLIVYSIFDYFFCNHNNLKFVRNIGGDEMMQHYVKGQSIGLAKSEHVCNKCGSFVYMGYRVNE